MLTEGSISRFFPLNLGKPTAFPQFLNGLCVNSVASLFPPFPAPICLRKYLQCPILPFNARYRAPFAFLSDAWFSS